MKAWRPLLLVALGLSSHACRGAGAPPRGGSPSAAGSYATAPIGPLSMCIGCVGGACRPNVLPDCASYVACFVACHCSDAACTGRCAAGDRGDATCQDTYAPVLACIESVTGTGSQCVDDPHRR